MDINQAASTLSALAQPTRLQAFRLLVSHDPADLHAGDITRELEVPKNTSSPHLVVLVGAGLACSERNGRSSTYRANLNHFHELTLYLLKECCNGRAEICVPLVAELAPCCAATSE